MTLNVARGLGWLVLAHGLSHAVLPLRGSIAPAVLVGDWIPVGLYTIAMVGFFAAGLGVLGYKPLDRAISPILVLASGLSLVAIVRFGDPALWFGAASDAVFLVLGLWRAHAGWPAHPHHGRVSHLIGVTVGAAALLYVAGAAILFPYSRTWGSTRDEILLALPGDAADRDLAFEVQHAVTIDVPPSRVWPWLVQLGQDRAGFYSYDWLERGFGVDIRNVKEIRPEWQSRRAGDRIPATQPGYLAGLFGERPGWIVTAVEPGHVLVLEGWGAFVLLPAADGKTRFIIRSTISHEDMPVWVSIVNLFAFEMPHFIMERRMMLTIKSLAEERPMRRVAR